MKNKFKCLHCGKCCDKVYTQINITIGDILRILSSINLDAKTLFEKYIGINPFPSEQENVYDYELGLNIPCKFRKDGKCTIYKARPLNCRMFPYWIMAKIPKEKIKEIVDSSYSCIHNTKIDAKTEKKYKDYVKQVGFLILQESRMTDDIMNYLKFKRNIDISKKAKAIEKKFKKSKGREFEKKIQEAKIKLCISLLDKKDAKEILCKLTKTMETMPTYPFASLEDLDAIEGIIK